MHTGLGPGIGVAGVVEMTPGRSRANPSLVSRLRSLLAEADLIMAVDGYPSRKDLTPEALQRVEAYS